MVRPTLCLLACTLLLTAPALAQTPGTVPKSLADIQAQMNAQPNTALPPVDTLTCEQMVAELGMAGAKMSGQLDPSFAGNAQAAYDASRAPPSGAPPADQVAQNHARINQLGSQVAGSMQGIDIQRMMALSTRFSAQNCKTPQ